MTPTPAPGGRDEVVIAEEVLDAMAEADFHQRLHLWAGEEGCMATRVIAHQHFQYGPAVGEPGVTLTLERGQLFELQGFANDRLLEERGYVRRLPEHFPVQRCAICGALFAEGLREHQGKRHGGGEAT
jgi:hypothetical protein